MTDKEKKKRVARLFAYYDAEVAMLGGEAEFKRMSAQMVADDIFTVGKSIVKTMQEAFGNDAE